MYIFSPDGTHKEHYSPNSRITADFSLHLQRLVNKHSIRRSVIQVFHKFYSEVQCYKTLNKRYAFAKEALLIDQIQMISNIYM